MKVLVTVTLFTAAAGYTLVVAFFVLLTIGYVRIAANIPNATEALLFVAVAVSPLPVWVYCWRRAVAWQRGSRPPL